jgi:hypothetical protein
MQHTSTFILNTVIKKYYSRHTASTSPLLYESLVIGILKTAVWKKIIIFETSLDLFVIDFTLVHFTCIFNEKGEISNCRYLVCVYIHIFESWPDGDPSSGSTLQWHLIKLLAKWVWVVDGCYDSYTNGVFHMKKRANVVCVCVRACDRYWGGVGFRISCIWKLELTVVL